MINFEIDKGVVLITLKLFLIEITKQRHITVVHELGKSLQHDNSAKTITILVMQCRKRDYKRYIEIIWNYNISN